MALENNYEKIQPSGEDFRTLPLPKAFKDWEHAVKQTPKKGLYFVSFFSVGSLDELLLKLDEQAAAEASKMPGFHYYYPDTRCNGKALSFCIWESAEDARQATIQPSHRAAVEYIEKEKPYQKYIISGYQVRRIEDQITFDQLFSHTFPVKSLV